MGRVKATLENVEADSRPALADPADDPALVIFGRDESGKGHAARFGAADVKLAERAAALMGYQVLRVVSPEIRASALQMAAGRIFASGRALAPFAKSGPYAALEALPGAYAPEPLDEPKCDQSLPYADVPQDWASISAGSLVLAASGDEAGSWYPAVVIELMADDLLTLKWRDWPDWDAFIRRQNALALLPATA